MTIKFFGPDREIEQAWIEKYHEDTKNEKNHTNLGENNDLPNMQRPTNRSRTTGNNRNNHVHNHEQHLQMP